MYQLSLLFVCWMNYFSKEYLSSGTSIQKGMAQLLSHGGGSRGRHRIGVLIRDLTPSWHDIHRYTILSVYVAVFCRSPPTFCRCGVRQGTKSLWSVKLTTGRVVTHKKVDDSNERIIYNRTYFFTRQNSSCRKRNGDRWKTSGNV